MTTTLLTLLLALFAPGTTPESYLRHVRFLAGDELRGRGNGTPELDRAADYIAGQFRAAGLEPAGDPGSFLQKLEVPVGSELGPANRLSLEVGHDLHEAALGRDYVPVSIGENLRVSGPVVFAGYGITAGELRYDDYSGRDVTDRIVLVLGHEPRENDPASPFGGRELTPYGHDNMKIINARYRNARAVLIVEDPLNHPDPAGDVPKLQPGALIDELGIPALRISRALADRLLAANRTTAAELQRKIDEGLIPNTFELSGAAVTLEVDGRRIRKEVSNVVGWLPGRDPKVADEYVVLGAHYDHLGLGGRSSMAPGLVGQIHHGADDNASGTAGLIELAAELARDRTRRRGLLFIAFAGEEIGLNGSAYWTRNPTRPLERAVAMINMDMIGRLRSNQIHVGGVGTSPSFRALVDETARAAGLEARVSQTGYGSSDHTSFNMMKVPVLFFFSGLHSDYHRPSDDWEKINAAGAVSVLSMVRAVTERLAGLPERPAFTKTAEPASGGPSRGGGSGYGAYFGSIPDMTDEVKGVRFADVRPASPAAKAGLQAGDVLVRFAGREIRSLEDFTYMLRTHKPGETVEVTVMRKGESVNAKVTLEVRRN